MKTEFVTAGPAPRPHKCHITASRRSVLRRPREAVRSGRPSGHASGIALLLASLCAFSLLFAFWASHSPLPGETLAVFNEAMGGNERSEGDDERLGRLKLVELPGMLTVFAPSDSPIMPLTAEAIDLHDDLTVGIAAPAGTEVFSMLSGTVKSVADGSEGSVVTVSHSDGIEITYYGLRDVLVERGQPVLQRTVLGTLKRDTLYIRVTKDGRPIDPVEFLGPRARLG